MHSHEDLLTAFSLSAVLRLRRRFHVSAGRYRQQRGNTSCKAANRRNEKKVQQRRPPPVAETGRSCWGQRPAGCERQRSRRWEPQPVLAQRLAFFRFDNSSGIIKGEQPLIRASRASKVAGAFLVLFWHAKENLAPRKSALPRAQAREPFLVLFWRAKENLTPLSSKTPAAPSPSPPAHFRGG